MIYKCIVKHFILAVPKFGYLKYDIQESSFKFLGFSKLRTPKEILFSEVLLLKERICSPSGSKFFPLTVQLLVWRILIYIVTLLKISFINIEKK